MGFYACATTKLKQTEDIVVKAHADYPKYNIIVTGHSLGASVCVLYGMSLKHKYSTMNVKIYPLACPPVFPLDKARECSSFITTVILNSDVVPRLSLGSLHDLKDRLLTVLADNPTFCEQMFRTFAGGSILGQTWTKELEEQKYGSSKLDMDKMKALKTHDKLYPPGKCVFISGDTWKPSEMRFEFVDNECFDEVLIHHSTDMFTSHMPDQYRKFLGASLQEAQRRIYGGVTDQSDCDPTTIHKLS